MAGMRVALLYLVSLSAVSVLAGCSADDSAMRSTKHYESTEYGLAFTYPQDLYLLESDHGDGNAPRLSIVLAEDQPMNRAYLAGTLDQPMEGPPMITIDVYDNPGLPASDWVTAHTNWILTDKQPELVQFGDRTYLLYFRDGLYAGKSAVAVEGGFTFVFSVTWISENDELLSNFSDLLNDVQLVRR